MTSATVEPALPLLGVLLNICAVSSISPHFSIFASLCQRRLALKAAFRSSEKKKEAGLFAQFTFPPAVPSSQSASFFSSRTVQLVAFPFLQNRLADCQCVLHTLSLSFALGQWCHSALVCLVKPSRPSSSSSSSFSCAALSPSEADPSVSKCIWRLGGGGERRETKAEGRLEEEKKKKRRGRLEAEECRGSGRGVVVGDGATIKTLHLSQAAHSFFVSRSAPSVRPSVHLPCVPDALQ